MDHGPWRIDRIDVGTEKRVLETLFFWHYDFSLRTKFLLGCLCFAAWCLALTAILWRGRGPATTTIAVLAFEDMSPAKDQEYFCDGISEEIINDLAQVGGLRVAARTSSFAYKGKREDIRNIGRKLGVRSVLEGSVRKTDSRLRITTQLIDVADGHHLWTEQYDRELEDVFAIQEEIAHNIARALKIKLSKREKNAIEEPPTRSIKAYDFYLRGRQFFYRHKRKYMQHAIDMFSRAIEQDSSYARAYAGRADCHSFLYWYFAARQRI